MPLETHIQHITEQLERQGCHFRTETLANGKILSEAAVYKIPQAYAIREQMDDKVYHSVPGHLDATILCPRKLYVGTSALVHLVYGVQTQDQTEEGLIGFALQPLTKLGRERVWNLNFYALAITNDTSITGIAYNPESDAKRKGMAIVSYTGLTVQQDIDTAIREIGNVLLRAQELPYTLRDMCLPKTF